MIHWTCFPFSLFLFSLWSKKDRRLYGLLKLLTSLSLHPSAFNNVLYVVVGCRSLLFSNTWNKKKEKERKEWTGRGNPRETLRSCGRETDRLECGRQAERQRIKIYSTHPPKKTHGWKSINQPILILIDVMYWLVPDYQRLFLIDPPKFSRPFISFELLDEKTRSQSNG